MYHFYLHIKEQNICSTNFFEYLKSFETFTLNCLTIQYISVENIFLSILVLFGCNQKWFLPLLSSPLLSSPLQKHNTSTTSTTKSPRLTCARLRSKSTKLSCARFLHRQLTCKQPGAFQHYHSRTLGNQPQTRVRRRRNLSVYSIKLVQSFIGKVTFFPDPI